MKITGAQSFEGAREALAELAENYPVLERIGLTIAGTEEKTGLEVSMETGPEGTRAVIKCARPNELFRGIGFIREWLERGETGGSRKEKPVFTHLTYMADCSRNAVCGVRFVKELIRTMALMGYDRLMLYTEDTYEVEGRPFFGYMRGRYSAQELRELDGYAARFGIELVPCIQTLAHLNAIFNWEAFRPVHDTGDILCCGLEETYALIEDMVRSYAQNCRSRIMNIGMDEAEMIGRGQFLRRFGYEERSRIMEKHLKRVLEICEKYGYTCMMWSDMFFKMGGKDTYYNAEITEEIRQRIPKQVKLIYWDYYSRDIETYRHMVKQHKSLGTEIVFAGGAWKWNGFAPMIHHSMQIAPLALETCAENGISDVIVTGWGDDGGEASQVTVLPVLSQYAEFCYARRMEPAWLGERLRACADACLEDFLLPDLLNLVPGNPSPGRMNLSAAKYLLYQDILLGIYDRHVDAERWPGYYAECAEKLESAAKKEGRYAYLFEELAALARLLSVKCALGVRIKSAYDAKDREALAQAQRDCLRTAALAEEFHQKQRAQWLRENKPFGQEVQDIRLAGVRERAQYAAWRLDEYLAGRLEAIGELEEERLMLGDSPEELPVWSNLWHKMATSCVM